MPSGNAKLAKGASIATTAIGAVGAVALLVIGQPLTAGLFGVIALAGLVMVAATVGSRR